jgi:hypothetical protein
MEKFSIDLTFGGMIHQMLLYTLSVHFLRTSWNISYFNSGWFEFVRFVALNELIPPHVMFLLACFWLSINKIQEKCIAFAPALPTASL